MLTDLFIFYWIFAALVLFSGETPWLQIIFAPITFPLIIGVFLRKMLNK